MGSSCSTSNAIDSLETSDQDPNNLTSVLSTFSSLYTCIKSSDKRYLCSCIVRSGFRGLGFVVCDGEDVWGKEVDLNYLQNVVSII